jgi:hypothetical protein
MNNALGCMSYCMSIFGICEVLQASYVLFPNTLATTVYVTEGEKFLRNAGGGSSL